MALKLWRGKVFEGKLLEKKEGSGMASGAVGKEVRSALAIICAIRLYRGQRKSSTERIFN
jgi:hypothetical protein